MSVLDVLNRGNQYEWQNVNRTQINMMDDLMRRRSCLTSLLDRLESELFANGLLIMSKGGRQARMSEDKLNEWKRIMTITGKKLLRAGFVRHLAVIRITKHDWLRAVPVFLEPDQYDNIEFKRKPLSDVVLFQVVKDKTVVRKAHVVTGLAHQSLSGAGEVKTVPGLMYGAEMKLKRAELEQDSIRMQAARTDIRVQQALPPPPTAAMINSGVGMRPPDVVGRQQRFPGVAAPEENFDLAQQVGIQHPESMTGDAADFDAAVEDVRATASMPLRIIPIRDEKSQIHGDELVVLKPGYSFVATPRPVVPSLQEDENAFERAAAQYSGYPRVFWSEADDVRGLTPSKNEEKKRRDVVRMWRDHICAKLKSIWMLLFAEENSQLEVTENKSTKAVSFVLPAAYNLEEIKQLVAMGVVHEDELCELLAGNAGWEGGDFDFKARMENLEETVEAARAAKAMKDQQKMQKATSTMGSGMGDASGKGVKRKAPPKKSKEGEEEEKEGPDKKKAKKDAGGKEAKTAEGEDKNG